MQNHKVLNLDPADPLTVSDQPIDPAEPTGITHRETLKMDWTHGHNSTIHNGISRIGFYSGGKDARFRDEDLADKWVEKSREFIATNKGQPFFLFFASHDNHVPRIPHERFQGKSGTGMRGDSVIQLDWCVGEIMAALEENGLTENTLVVFCSDNGPVLDDGYDDGSIKELGAHDPSGPFTGGKYTVYEGGTRIPFITRWPGKIPSGVSDAIVCTIDIAASFAALVGVTLPDDACLDSFNILPALLGEKGANGRSELIQQDNGNNGVNNDYGFRSGDWKLVRRTNKYQLPAIIFKHPIPPREGLHTLYFLPEDPFERKDLCKQNPEKAAELVKRLDEIIAAGRSR